MIIWIASYPKSGNTWIRSMLSYYLYSKDGKFEFNLLNKIPQFPLQKHFKSFTNKFWDIDEISKYWILAQETINLNNKLNFLKTHHANVVYNNYRFTNEDNCLAAIYVVRDPRNVVMSLSNHFSLSIDQSKKFLFSPTRKVKELIKREWNNQTDIFKILGNWAEHYKSWKNYKRNVLIIRYEDLLENTNSTFLKIIKFLSNYMDISFNEEKIKKTIEVTSFDKLKNLENQFGFPEAANLKNEKGEEIKNMSVKFFNKGKSNDWKKLLDKNIASEIELKFNSELKELKYLD